MLVTTALIATAFTLLPTAAATSCSVHLGADTDVNNSCTFGCSAGDTITVSLAGTGTITGSCGGASATCNATANACTSPSLTTATAGGTGTCSLTGVGDGSCSAPGVDPSCSSASNVNYNPTETNHHFVLAANFGATIDSQFGGVGVANVFDTSTCPTGDGDNDTGQGGAQFPEVSQGACDPGAPVVGHHNGGAGATATVQSNANLPMDYTFGTDGQDPAAWTAGQHCTGNNVVSDSFDTDPVDCGQGVTGHFGGTSFSATLGTNPNPHANTATDPNPYDGVTGFGPLATGASYTDPNGVQCFGVLDGSAWSFFVFGPSINGFGDLITGGPLLDLSGCPAPIGDDTATGGLQALNPALPAVGTGPLPGSGTCGLGSIPTVDPSGLSEGISVPVQGDITSP